MASHNRWTIDQILEPEEVEAALFDGCHLKNSDMVLGYIRYNAEDQGVVFIHPGYSLGGSRTPPTAEPYSLNVDYPEGWRVIKV